MSGQPIKVRDGKLYIREYEVNGVKFDNYADGKLYDYKGNYSFMFDKNGALRKWVKEPQKMREDAKRQVNAANGVPVVWKVGRHQVRAFKRAVGNVQGLTIEP